MRLLTIEVMLIDTQERKIDEARLIEAVKSLIGSTEAIVTNFSVVPVAVLPVESKGC